jgi:hypothetical protein
MLGKAFDDAAAARHHVPAELLEISLAGGAFFRRLRQRRAVELTAPLARTFRIIPEP